MEKFEVFTISPYLFVMVMTCIIHDTKNLLPQLSSNRVPNTTFDEVLFADDTILFSTSEDALQAYTTWLELIAARYGLKFNYTKF